MSYAIILELFHRSHSGQISRELTADLMDLFEKDHNMTFSIFVFNIRLQIHINPHITHSFFFCLFSFERVSRKMNVCYTRIHAVSPPV